jgi:hypothetical protein
MNNLLYPIHGGQVIAKSNDDILIGTKQNELIIYSRDENLRMLFGVMDKAPTMILDHDSVLIPLLETNTITSIEGDITLGRNLITECNLTSQMVVVNTIDSTDSKITFNKTLQTQCNVFCKELFVDSISCVDENQQVKFTTGIETNTIGSLNGESSIDIFNDISVPKIDSTVYLLSNSVVINSNSDIFVNAITLINTDIDSNYVAIDSNANIRGQSIYVSNSAVIESNVYTTDLVAEKLKIKTLDGNETLLVDSDLNINAKSVSSTSYVISSTDGVDIEVVDANANVLAEHVKCRSFSIYNPVTENYVPYVVSGNNIDISSIKADYIDTNTILIDGNPFIDVNRDLQVNTISINNVVVFDSSNNITNSIIDESTKFQTDVWYKCADDIKRIRFKSDGNILFNSDNGIILNDQGISILKDHIIIESTTANFKIGTYFEWNFYNGETINGMLLNQNDGLIVNTQITCTSNIDCVDINASGDMTIGNIDCVDINASGDMMIGNIDCVDINASGDMMIGNIFKIKSSGEIIVDVVTCNKIISSNNSIEFHIGNNSIMNIDNTGTLSVDVIDIQTINNIITMSESNTTVTFHTVGSSLNPSIVLNYDEGKIETSNVTVTELHTNNISGKLYFNDSDNSVTFFNPLNIGDYHIKFNDNDSVYAIETTSVNVTNITTESINSQSIKFVNNDVVIKDKATFSANDVIYSDYTNTFNYTVGGEEVVMLSIDSSGVYVKNLITNQITLPSDIVVESLTALNNSNGIEIIINNSLVGKWTESGLQTASIYSENQFDINIGGDVIGHFDKNGLHMPVVIDNMLFNTPNMAVKNISSTNIIQGGIFIVDKPMSSEDARNSYNSTIDSINSVSQMMTPINEMHVLSNFTLGNDNDGVGKDYPMYVDIENNSDDRISAYMTGSVVALSCETFSDLRIKQNINSVDELDVFAKINKLNVVNYSYIEDDKQKKNGFIAQEVEKIFPDAVRTMNSYIPDIMLNAEVTAIRNSNEYVLRLIKNANGIHDNVVLNISDMIKIKVGDKSHCGRICNIDSKDSSIITVRFENKLLYIGQYVFVVGKLVEDFKAVDYTTIFSYLVSAVQYLSKQLLNN